MPKIMVSLRSIFFKKVKILFLVIEDENEDE
jgi:hypothetical protein